MTIFRTDREVTYQLDFAEYLGSRWKQNEIMVTKGDLILTFGYYLYNLKVGLGVNPHRLNIRSLLCS